MSVGKKYNYFYWEKIEKLCTLIALVGIFWAVSGFYFSASYGGVARTYYLLILLPAIIASPIWFRKASFFSWSWFFFLLPILYLALSNFWVEDGHMNTNRSIFYFIKPFFFLIFLLLAVQMVLQKFDYVDRYLIKLITFVALITGIISLLQYIPSALESGSWPRMAGMSANHDINVTASLYGVNIFFCAYGLVKWHSRWFWPLLASMLISLIIVLLTQSKVPLVYFSVALCWLFLQARQEGTIKKTLPIVMFLIFISVLILLYFDRVPFLNKLSSYSIRFELWTGAIEQSKSHWWFGHGVGSTVTIPYGGLAYPSHAHNFVIDTLLYGGVTGAIFLIAQIFFVALSGFILVKKHPSYLPIVVWFYMGVFFLLTNGQQPLVKPHHIWFYYWLPMVLILGKNLRKDNTKKSTA